jgi:hypothetical protein
VFKVGASIVEVRPGRVDPAATIRKNKNGWRRIAVSHPFRKERGKDGAPTSVGRFTIPRI